MSLFFTLMNNILKLFLKSHHVIVVCISRWHESWSRTLSEWRVWFWTSGWTCTASAGSPAVLRLCVSQLIAPQLTPEHLPPALSGPTLGSREGFEIHQEHFNYAFILICRYLRGLSLSLIKGRNADHPCNRSTVTGDWAAGRSGWSLRLERVLFGSVAAFLGN